MKLVQQSLFGGPNGPVELIGDCYPACIASLLEIPLEEVPHIYQMYPGDTDRANLEMLSFLAARNMCSLHFNYEPWCHRFLQDTLAIFGGKSPRGNWDHAVVGEITRTGWKPIWDPHPSGSFLEGEPTDVEIIFEPMKFTRLTEAA